MINVQEEKTIDSIYSGSISLTGFFLALFSYSFLEYKSVQGGAEDEFPIIIPLVMAIMLAICSLCAAATFYIISNNSTSMLRSIYLAVLVGVTISPVLVWIWG